MNATACSNVYSYKIFSTIGFRDFIEVYCKVPLITHSVLNFVLQSLFERQGMTPHGGLHPGIERGHMPIPKGMSRTKSFGKTSTPDLPSQL